MPSMILSPGEEWLTFVGDYNCALTNIARIEELLQNYYAEVGPNLIGLVGVAIHRKIEGNGICTISQWESEEAVIQVTRDTKLHPYFQELRTLCEVTYTSCRTEKIVLPPSRAKAPLLAASGLVIGDKCCQTSFTVANHSPDDADEVMRLYLQLHDVTVRNVRGFMGAAMLSATTRSQTFSYAQWSDVSLVEKALQLPQYQAALSQLTRLASYQRNWFEVVHSLRIPKQRRLL